MNPQDKRREEAAEWLRIASDDPRLADAALGLEPPITGLALYHAQRTAEKALKAFWVYRGRAFPLTHNLNDLARILIELDTALLEVIRPGLELSDFATLHRYPGEPEAPDAGQVRPWLWGLRTHKSAGSVQSEFEGNAGKEYPNRLRLRRPARPNAQHATWA